MNKPTDPHDPHHVTLGLIIDLQSTNLTRQQEILRLRRDLDHARSEASMQTGRADRAEAQVRHALTYYGDQPARKPKELAALVFKALSTVEVIDDLCPETFKVPPRGKP